MKKFALTAAVALAVASPALAQTQLERSVGAASGQYTLSQLIRLKDAQNNSASESRTYFGNDQIDVSQSRHSPVALSIFRQLRAEHMGDN